MPGLIVGRAVGHSVLVEPGGLPLGLFLVASGRACYRKSSKSLDGVNLDSPEWRDAIASVGQLEISDLVVPEVYQEAFSESATEDEGEQALGGDRGSDKCDASLSLL